MFEPLMDRFAWVDSLRKVDLRVPLALSALVFAIAWLRPFGDSPDDYEYEAFFEWIRLVDWYALSEARFEPAFVAPAIVLVQLFSSSAVVWGLMASLAFLPKAWAIEDMDLDTTGLVLVFAFYFVRFMPMHELTQLRVAYATAVLMLAWVARQRGAWKVAAGLAALAVAFHLSALVVAPLVFLRTDRQGMAIAAGVATLLAVRVVIPAAIRLLPEGLGTLAIYEAAGFGDTPPNPLGPTVVLDWIAIAGGLALWKQVTPGMRQVLLVQMIGMGIYYGARDFPVFAHRLREMMTIFWVFFVGQGWKCEGEVRRLAVVFAALSLALYSYVFFLSGKFFG